ncbi:MAG: DMT family transporter [bacterium]
MTRDRRPTAVLVLTLGVAAVSTAAVLIRLAAAPALTVTAWRLAGGGLAFGLYQVARGRGMPWRGLGRRELLLAGLSAAALALHFMTWILSLSYTTVVSSVVLVSTTPIWVALASRSVLGEAVGPRAWAGVMAAVAGSLIIAWSDAGAGEVFAGRAPLLGDLLALAGAWCVAVYYLAGRRLRRTMDTVSYVSLVYGGAAVIALLAAFLTRTPLTGFGPNTYLYLVLIALVPQIIGHTSFNWALGHVSATLTTTAVLLEPVGSGLLAWWILSEAPAVGGAMGGVVVLTGIWLAAGAEPERAPTAP